MKILTELKNKDVPKNKPLKSNKKQMKPIANAAYKNRKKLSSSTSLIKCTVRAFIERKVKDINDKNKFHIIVVQLSTYNTKNKIRTIIIIIIIKITSTIIHIKIKLYCLYILPNLY